MPHPASFAESSAQARSDFRRIQKMVAEAHVIPTQDDLAFLHALVNQPGRLPAKLKVQILPMADYFLKDYVA